MKYWFIRENQQPHSVEKMAMVLNVSRSGYYKWLNRSSSERKQENEELIEQIKGVQKHARYSYGSPRVTQALHRKGYQVGENRIAALMRAHGLGRRVKKRFRSTTDSENSLPIVENLLNREFSASRPNRVWVSDLTFISTAEGWMYLCVVIDLYSRKVVGWAMGTRMKAALVLQALMMAVVRRQPPEGLLFHSDRGSQYCSRIFRNRLEKYQMKQSMSRKGNCWDNAPAESFFKTLKSELIGHGAFRSREEARRAVFEYIEVFYNRQRLHSTLGYVSPVEFEQLMSRVAA